MAEPEGSVIPIIYSDDAAGEKGLFSGSKSIPARIGQIDSDELAQNLSAICTRLAKAFTKAQEATGSFDLDEFEVTLDLSAKGEVRVIASVSSEIHGGLKLVFRRHQD